MLKCDFFHLLKVVYCILQQRLCNQSCVCFVCLCQWFSNIASCKGQRYICIIFWFNNYHDINQIELKSGPMQENFWQFSCQYSHLVIAFNIWCWIFLLINYNIRNNVFTIFLNMLCNEFFESAIVHRYFAATANCRWNMKPLRHIN